MDVCLGGPALSQIQILLYPMPHYWIELAAGKQVYFRAGCNGHVGDDHAWVMCWEGIVKGGGKNSVSTVQEDDCDAEDGSD